MSAFITPNNCIRCERKTSKLSIVSVYGGHKERKVGDTTTININYSPTFYLCKDCVKEFYKFIKNENV